ncbi:MAG: hypothetical protein V7609_1493 [Verrucomicrobiota bacterium]
MDPLTASTTFATLVGLICNWRQERAAIATDKFQDFLTWLSNHNFEQLRSLILGSDEVQQSLLFLLREDTAKLGEKLGFACSALSSISDRIEALAPLARALNASSQTLSDQAVAILKRFDETGAERLILFARRKQIGFLPMGRVTIGVAEPRFLEDDILSLEGVGFLRLVAHNNDGEPIFALTRPGAAFAAQIPTVAHQDNASQETG